MMILGKGTIVGTSVWLTYLLTTKFAKEVTQPILPAVLIGLVAYLVASLFLSVFSFACTAILHCFILDEDTGGDDSLTPESLIPFMEKINSERATKLKENVNARKSKGGAGANTGGNTAKLDEDQFKKLDDEPPKANNLN